MAPPRRHPSATPLRADRVRKIDARGFAYIPNAFLQDGFFSQMTPSERSLYLLFVLLGDRNGVSFLGHITISALLGSSLDEYLEARQALADKDLIAIADLGTRVQVLALPRRPVTPERSSPTPAETSTPPALSTKLEVPNHELSLTALQQILRDLRR